jgi:polyisoprenoid-binding protein YceI
MPLPPGEYRLGPDDVTLAVRTVRVGAAAKAGHDLLIHVTSWSATLVLSEDRGQSSLELDADPTSLRVIEGTGGAFELGDDDIANIHQTIDDEVLLKREISFRSTAVRAEEDCKLRVEGDLTIGGTMEPIAFELEIGDDGALAGAATVTQTDWGMKPYSALFGALKLADDVEVTAEGHVRPQSR